MSMEWLINAEWVQALWGHFTEWVRERLAGKQDSLTPDGSLTLTDGAIAVKSPVNRILTAEEFDALPEEQKQRGLYVIQDAGGGSTSGGNFSGEIYSTEEVRIGTWIDGKPLYRQMYTVTLPSSIQTSGFQLQPYPDTFEIKGYSGLFVDVWGAIHTVPDHWANDFLTFCFMDNYIRVCFNSTSYVSKPVTLFLEYTKTTD